MFSYKVVNNPHLLSVIVHSAFYLNKQLLNIP